jgi:hypothetical protein
MIKLRLDVDYAYPSRIKSFFYTTINLRSDKDYLKNSKIIAKMINESQNEIQAFWFFTPHTIPDDELMQLLHPERHEVALHIANDPFRELGELEKATKRKVRYYTIHGTARLPARLMWRRKIWEARKAVPKDFPLKSFYEFPTLGFDILCYSNTPSQALEIAKSSIAKGEVLHVHPEWLFQRGTVNHRGPFYEPWKEILEVDKDLAAVAVLKHGFVRIARHPGTKEYERDFFPTKAFTEKLGETGIDIFTFLERRWCCPISNPPETWVKTEDNVALVEVTTYPAWLEQIGKKTRNMVRKAEKSGVKVEVTKPSEALAKGIWGIYNETPIRQERAFPHYGQSLQNIASTITNSTDTFIAASLQDELIGFIQLVQGDKVTIISQILSLQRHSDKAVNNALIAKAVEVCVSTGGGWLMYARMGNHPSLDNFKQNNGFRKYPITRYYVPITGKGRTAMRIGLHREPKDALPERVKTLLIPVYNWVSRNKIRLRRNPQPSGSEEAE